ncbi:MAG: DUF2155 domain-containing protein [Parvibaculaceae bacterium]
MKRFLGLVLLLLSAPALAQPIKNPIALFNGLDKITGRITAFEVKVDETTEFGALAVRPRVCNTRDVTEQPKTTAFVEVDEKHLDGTRKRIFTGWMFAESPGLNAVEHPIFDVWLTGCRDPNAPPVPKEEAPPEVDLDSESVPQDTD